MFIIMKQTTPTPLHYTKGANFEPYLMDTLKFFWWTDPTRIYTHIYTPAGSAKPNNLCSWMYARTSGCSSAFRNSGSRLDRINVEEMHVWEGGRCEWVFGPSEAKANGTLRSSGPLGVQHKEKWYPLWQIRMMSQISIKRGLFTNSIRVIPFFLFSFWLQ